MGEADPRVGAGVKVSQSLMGKLRREVLALGEQGGSWGGVFAEALRGVLRVDCVEDAACAGGDEALWAACFGERVAGQGILVEFTCSAAHTSQCCEGILHSR